MKPFFPSSLFLKNNNLPRTGEKRRGGKGGKGKKIRWKRNFKHPPKKEGGKREKKMGPGEGKGREARFPLNIRGGRGGGRGGLPPSKGGRGKRKKKPTRFSREGLGALFYSLCQKKKKGEKEETHTPSLLSCGRVGMWSVKKRKGGGKKKRGEKRGTRFW